MSSFANANSSNHEPWIRLALVLHNHQPVGNFDEVCEQALQSSYRPFLDVLDDFPELTISLHISGPLLDWLLEHHPEDVDRLRGMLADDRLEILGGSYAEAVLPGIPRADRIGQVRLYADQLESVFGVRPRGMWIPERVWDPSLTGDLALAGMRYTLLDDHHFIQSGVPEERAFGYHLAEDEGRLLKIFPICERLRHCLPFEEPQHAIDHLRWIAETHSGTTVTFGDDGEKFGTWPGTSQHVYGDGWLRRFFGLLMENRTWLRTVTLGEAETSSDPVGRVELAENSYPEMTAWALPPNRQQELKSIRDRGDAGHDGDWWRLRSHIRQGTWRNFRVRYPEINEMYARMLQVSARVQKTVGLAESAPEVIAQHRNARIALYRAQCNCPYWHGAFGGVYLPHLRDAVYRYLLEADEILDQIEGKTGHRVEVRAFDQNLDGQTEVELRSDRLNVLVSPAQGGMIYELDLRPTRHNLLATIDRRPEAYHDSVRESAHEGVSDPAELVDRPHEAVRFKGEHLDRLLRYDSWPRKMLLDHFLPTNVTLETFRDGTDAATGPHRSDFHTGTYSARMLRPGGAVAVVLVRSGSVDGHPVTVTKSIRLEEDRGGRLAIRYDLSDLPPGVGFRFAVEFGFSGIAAGAVDRFLYGAEGERLGTVGTEISLNDTARVGIVDEWRGEDISLSFSHPGEIWSFPLQTVSQSEGGFEAVHQSTVLVPSWDVISDPDGRWSVEIDLICDTSAAQARKLADRIPIETTD